MSIPSPRQMSVALPFRPHLPAIAAVAAVSTLLYAPMFREGFPPGVDAPTFLHFSWFVQKTLSGQGGLVDPYWYGGLSVFKTYPPLAYTLVGLLAYITPLDLALAYKVAQLMAYIGIGVATYWLAVELRTGVFPSLVAALLSVMAYPVFSALGLWGWFTTLAALPLGIASLAALERALRLRSFPFAALGGVLLGLSLLAHHMTAFAFALALVAWGIVRLFTRAPGRPGLVPLVGLFAATTGIVTLWWLVPFLLHAVKVGFQREVPGNWSFPFWLYVRAVVDVRRIGLYIYPSYLGITPLALALGGTVLSLLQPSRATAYGAAAVVLLLFSVGEQANPLLRVRPFDGLDVARFHLFLVPFAAVLGAFYLSELRKVAGEPARRLLRRPWGGALVWGLVVVALLAFPVHDAVRASLRTLEPFRLEPSGQEALDWLKGPDSRPGKVLTVGWWNWGDFLVPYETGRAVMGGWYDEGTPDWRAVRQVRHMMWLANVDVPRLYEIMAERDTTYVVVYDYLPIEHPREFMQALRARPDLFREVVAWDGASIFQLRTAGPETTRPGQAVAAVSPPPLQ